MTVWLIVVLAVVGWLLLGCLTALGVGLMTSRTDVGEMTGVVIFGAISALFGALAIVGSVLAIVAGAVDRWVGRWRL